MMASIGMATAAVEGVLAQIFKEKEGDHFIGGPAYYITHGLGRK